MPRDYDTAGGKGRTPAAIAHSPARRPPRILGGRPEPRPRGRSAINGTSMNRRELMKWSGAAVASTWAAGLGGARGAADVAPVAGAPLLRIDPTPRHDLSPWLYMHFMEPLGVTDSSIEASWDHNKDQWR